MLRANLELTHSILKMAIEDLTGLGRELTDYEKGNKEGIEFALKLIETDLGLNEEEIKNDTTN